MKKCKFINCLKMLPFSSPLSSSLFLPLSTWANTFSSIDRKKIWPNLWGCIQTLYPFFPSPLVLSMLFFLRFCCCVVCVSLSSLLQGSVYVYKHTNSRALMDSLTSSLVKASLHIHWLAEKPFNPVETTPSSIASFLLHYSNEEAQTAKQKNIRGPRASHQKKSYCVRWGALRSCRWTLQVKVEPRCWTMVVVLIDHQRVCLDTFVTKVSYTVVRTINTLRVGKVSGSLKFLNTFSYGSQNYIRNIIKVFIKVLHQRLLFYVWQEFFFYLFFVNCWKYIIEIN